MPWCLVYLWSRFNRLSNRRGTNGFGPSLLTYPEIDAFQRLTGFRFTPWEIEMIEMLDHAYIAARAEAKDSGG
ncbi:phage tail assembly chaperone [Aminobacter niigataensis]|uniref:phage tail assembly chaperone n=1 Tax=Aminobacter niigataensis TaxID=83265 RepID=UPI003CCDB308